MATAGTLHHVVAYMYNQFTAPDKWFNNYRAVMPCSLGITTCQELHPCSRTITCQDLRGWTGNRKLVSVAVIIPY